MTPVELGFLAGDPEPRFVIFAKDQPQYDELPALLYQNGNVLIEMELSEEERERITRGENIRLWVATHNQPLQPLHLEVTNEHIA